MRVLGFGLAGNAKEFVSGPRQEQTPEELAERILGEALPFRVVSWGC